MVVHKWQQCNYAPKIALEDEQKTLFIIFFLLFLCKISEIENEICSIIHCFL